MLEILHHLIWQLPNNFLKKKINKLHQNVRRLRKKLTLLQKLIEHLKNINLISEQAHDDILVFMCEI